MWSASEESSGAMEGSPPEAVIHTKEICEQNKNQLESIKEIMMRNQQSLKRKEEEVQEYARRLSKIKSRAKLSRRSKEGASSSKDIHSHKTESIAKDVTDDIIDDISQAKTPKAKSSLLQRKLVENRKVFEQRNKELTETKRAVEEKVEAIRQQLDETDLAAAEYNKDQLIISPRPLITSDVMTSIQVQNIQEKEKKIMELNNKIVELETTILDLQENLKEKDSVIDSKTKAVTLMSADLSKKGKTTLDTLEDTKDEMRIMQENFILIEMSLKNKNANLLEQLQERDNRLSELEHKVNRFEEQLKEQKIAESASADFSRSTMDTLADTKDAMKSMQENFILVESSLKLKNDNLLQQLGQYEIKLAEAKEKIFQLESGAGIVTSPAIEDLQFRIEKLEQTNRQLLDEKYELQKNIAELQDKIIASKSVYSNDTIIEKDNRITELENLVEELKQSNKLLEEESKTELQMQVAELSSNCETHSNKIINLEKQVHELEAEKNDILARLSVEQVPKEDVVIKLTKELEDLNKSMIKLKAQHRIKVKNLQKQLENFKMVSDTNAELVRLDNQVALLEEEKGNLQLSLVDFDELKASAGDWQERVADLESKVSSQTKEIQMHIDAIAILENQKLDLTQELHTVKQEILALEAENAESENLRVTAEMKVVELEEQLETIHKEQSENKFEIEHHELLKKLDVLTQENTELYSKLNKMEEKGASDTGSTESFEAIQMNDRNDLLKKIEDLEQKNNKLTLKLSKLEEKDDSHAGSTESFETINDTDRSELIKKIEQLMQENNDLTMKLSRIEEKGSSDTGSTESFERIPEHNDSPTKIELLTQENNELVIKLTKLEERLNQIESSTQLDISKIDHSSETLKDDSNLRLQIETLTRENNNLMREISQLKPQIEGLTEENNRLQDRIEILTVENTELVINRTKLQERLQIESSHTSQMSIQMIESADQINALIERQHVLEKELTQLRKTSIEHSVNVTSCETDDAKSKLATLEKENAQMIMTIAQLEERINNQTEDLIKITREKEKLEHTCDDLFRERLELIDKLEKLNREQENVTHEKQELHEQINLILLQKSSDDISEVQKSKEDAPDSQTIILASLEKELENNKMLIAEYKNQIEEMNMKLESMEAEVQKKTKQLLESEASHAKENLERELKDMFVTAEEWKFKYDDMQEKMQTLEQAKASIEETFRTLENDNKKLLEVIKEKEIAIDTLKDHLQGIIDSLETRLHDEIANVTAKEYEIANLKVEIEKKDQDLHTKYTQLQNGMITIDSLQDELNNYSMKLKENETALSSSLEEIARLNDTVKEKEEEICTLKDNISQISEALEQSKPIAEFKEMLENLRNKETRYIELQNKYEEILKENNELLQKVENMSKLDENVKNELIKKEQEIDSLLIAKKNLDAQIEEVKSDKNEAEKQIWELQVILDNQTSYAEKVQSELTNEYKQMERLKTKHIEDIAMLNRRLEDVIEELVEKTQENEAMKTELEQKELHGKNFTEEMKTILENKVAELEQKLSESENKLQTQSEKMKKIVATFNKKKVACQELEARVAELEEKWTTEKDEKEVKNKQIQEVEISMREKDNKIHDLEEKLLQTKNNTVEILANSEKFEKESISLREKITMLMGHVEEMDEEIEKQRAEIERIFLDMMTEKTAKENIAKEYEFYKQTSNKEDEQKQAILDEVKEQARELSVRMQVMETEYVEQLATIKNLKAENGLLLSKQTQIDEKLENAEKKSEERRVLIEQLQKEIVSVTSTQVTTQVPEQNERREDNTQVTQHCDHSEQCQNLVQALEARLQERQAEIENLNNELANSYGNIVLLHDESQRYNDMMMQTAQERFNQSLMDQTNTLQQEIDSLKTEKAMSDQKVSELEAELKDYRCKNAECKVEIPEEVESPIIVENQQQKHDDSQLFDSAKIFDTTVTSDTDTLVKKEIERLQNLLKEQQNECSEHMKKMKLLLNNIEEEKLRVQELQDQFEDSQNKLNKTENLLSEKNAQVDSLNAELDNIIRKMNDLKMLQEQYHTTEVEPLRLQELVTDKSTQIHLLITELDAIYQQMNSQLQQHTDMEADLRTEISFKDTEIFAIKTELTSMKETIEALITERNQQVESYKLQINNLETEARNVKNNDLIQEWEQHISAITTERDLLQLQVNDLTRSLKLKEPFASQRNLQIELEDVLRERDQAQMLVANLTQALDDSKPNIQELEIHGDSLTELTSTEKSIIEQELEQVPTAVEESISQHEQLAQALIEKEMQQRDSGWDNGSENLIDEESWDWNAENVQSAVSSQHLSTMTLSAEMQLRAKIEDLQNIIKDLEAQNTRIVEENKATQVKSGKLIKKLKEYKVQIESLQQQLKTQRQTDSFFDLDTAIEEELKAQITNLEKALNEIKEEKKNIIAEKEALLNRFDVVVSANERYMEMKERQDMEVEVLRIQNKELDNKIQSLEWQLLENAIKDTTSSLHENQSNLSSSEIDKSIAHSQPQKRSADDFEVISKKYKEEMDDLKDELEALATENEQLQHFLEEQKATIANLESRINSNELTEKLNALNRQNERLQSDLNKSKEECDILRRQYEQSLIDANDQVTAIRQNSDLLKIEFAEKVKRLETEIDHLQRVLEEKKVLEDNTLINSEEKFSAVNASLMEVTELLNARVQEVADLKQDLQVQYMERQQAEATLQLEIQNLTREIDERKQDLGALKQAFNDKEHELMQQRNIETVNTVVSEATQELVQKHAIEIEEKDKELRDLTEKLIVLESTVAEYTVKLRDCATKLETQQQQIAYLKEDLTERNSIIGTTQTDMNLMNEKLREKQQELIQYEEEKTKLAAEVEKRLADIQRLQSRLNVTEAAAVDLQECSSRIYVLEQEVQILKSEKESILMQYDQETEMYQAQLENNKEQINALKRDLREKTEQLHYVSTQLCAKENDLEGIRAMVSDKDSLLEITSQELRDKRTELERLRNEQSSQMIDDLSISRMGHDDDAELQSTVHKLKAQMEAKQQELEHLKYVLSENTYPTIIQQMQDRINCLYNEKATLEASLRAATESLTEKQQQVNFLTRHINEQNYEGSHISKEEANSLSRDRKSVYDQDEIVRLQNELHAKQQEINELRYVIAEKDSQLCLQASMEPQSDDFELRETVQRLMGELYGKEQEVQTLKLTITELQEQVLLLKDYKRLSEESRNAIERLTSEKEQIRNEAEEFLTKELQRKESEIDEIKQKLSGENRKLLAELRSRDSDIENLKAQFERLRTTADDRANKLQQKENELTRTIDDLAEKERRLAELSITKDTELHNLKVQIHEKGVRIDELLTLSAEEEKQLDELRRALAISETEVDRLKELLAQKISEHDLIQHALKKDMSAIEAAPSKGSETIQTVDNKEVTSSELDLALYMLHQRDVRCEELTHELMQLLEERDTLQLRLSNAIRVNEELRRVSSVEASPTKDLSSASHAIIEPVELVERPSPSRSEGPVEIAKEAIDTSIEDKEILALKLSQLHSVSHSKDVRLKDERELRHTQQMSLLAHRDVLNTLPPEAAARFVNANYTLSRDVQSQSSVLLNWLWGKSTPKVVHM